MLEYILFSNNYCKHSKTVIKIKFTNVKASTVHSQVKYTKWFENILGINKCKRTALILGFLFVDFDI